MKTVKEIEGLARDHSDARETLSNRVQNLNDEIEMLKRKHLPSIKHAVNKAKKTHEALHNAIDESRDLFVNPKTMIAHGIKVGVKKESDTLEWEDESQVIKRIKKIMVNQIDVLINAKETLSKTALKQLSNSDLKKIGVETILGKEVVTIKDTNTDIDKLVKKLLNEKDLESD